MPLQVRATSLSRDENVPFEAFNWKLGLGSTCSPWNISHTIRGVSLCLLFATWGFPKSCRPLCWLTSLKQSIPRLVNGLVFPLWIHSTTLKASVIHLLRWFSDWGLRIPQVMYRACWPLSNGLTQTVYPQTRQWICLCTISPQLLPLAISHPSASSYSFSYGYCTGFWLLFLLTYNVCMMLPLCWCRLC